MLVGMSFVAYRNYIQVALPDEGVELSAADMFHIDLQVHLLSILGGTPSPIISFAAVSPKCAAGRDRCVLLLDGKGECRRDAEGTRFFQQYPQADSKITVLGRTFGTRRRTWCKAVSIEGTWIRWRKL